MFIMKRKNPYRKKLLLILFLCVTTALSACAPTHTSGTSLDYGVFIDADPENLTTLSAYETVVIDAAYFSKEDIAQLHEHNVTVYTYLNIGSIETFRDAYPQLKRYTLSPYENWPDEYWVDVSALGWQEYIAQQAQVLVAKDVDGFFLDNADVYYHYPQKDILDGLVEIINDLEAYGKKIMINGGDVFVTEAVLNQEIPRVQITSVNQECVFTNIDFIADKLLSQEAETSAYYQNYLQTCRENDLEVYLLEYAEASDKALCLQIEAYCRENECIYYLASTKELSAD